MKAHITSLILISQFATQLCAADPALSLSISIPSSPEGEHALDTAQVPYFHLILSNSSDKAQTVWPPRSLPTHRALSFEFTDPQGKTSKVTSKNQVRVSYKAAEPCILQPNESLVFEIHYANTNAWENFPIAMPGYPPITLRAIYEVEPEPIPGTNTLWSGRIVSPPLKVTVYPRY